MLKCFACKLESAVGDARFCFHCGKPLQQPSPYTDPSENILIALLTPDGVAPKVCPVKKLPLKTCANCGRLHTLAKAVCVCGATLRESGMAFSGAGGSLDGARRAFWPHPFPERTPKNLRTTDVAVPLPLVDVRSVAARYGWVAFLTPMGVLICEPRGDALVPLHATQFTQRGDEPREILLDNGRAFVRCDNHSVVFSLPAQGEELRISERVVRQAKSSRWWARLTDDGAGKASIRVRQCDGALSGADNALVSLNFPADAVTDMAVGETAHGAAVYLATNPKGQGTLARWRTETTTLESAPLPETVDWSRVAALPDGAIAMGYAGQNRQAVLVHWRDPALTSAAPTFAPPATPPAPTESAAIAPLADAEALAAFGLAPSGWGGTPAGHNASPASSGGSLQLVRLSQGYRADFAFTENTLYILHESGYGALPLNRLAEPPTAFLSRNSQQTEGSIWAVRDAKGEERVLYFRADHMGRRLNLAMEQYLSQIGPLQIGGNRLVCLVEDQFLLIDEENGKTALMRATFSP